MRSETFTFRSDDGKEIFVYKWMPEEGVTPRGIVQIAHGMAEHAGRYELLAENLTEHGFLVYGNDHRGHGHSAESVERQGILAEKDGFEWMVTDVHKLTTLIKVCHGDLPFFLLGHSMGSFITQRYIMLYGDELTGALLSGTNGRQGLVIDFGAFSAKRECRKRGREARSVKLNLLSFGSFNCRFKPNRTEFDWLSRDPKVVDRYIADPYCGAIFPAGFFYDFLEGLKVLEDRQNMAKVPKSLPIYLFSGDKDPVGKEGRGVRKLYLDYLTMGIEDVTLKLYKDGRHEILNEINKEEVMADLLNWIEAHLK